MLTYSTIFHSLAIHSVAHSASVLLFGMHFIFGIMRCYCCCCFNLLHCGNDNVSYRHSECVYADAATNCEIHYANGNSNKNIDKPEQQIIETDDDSRKTFYQQKLIIITMIKYP